MADKLTEPPLIAIFSKWGPTVVTITVSVVAITVLGTPATVL